jgi:hypothetical protein
MGMFDDLVIDKFHLPNELKDYENGWQTKSLDCYMNIIKIDENGNLFETICHYHNEKENPKRRYHVGEIRFYQTINDVWYEFIGFFDEGIMFRLIQIEPKK